MKFLAVAVVVGFVALTGCEAHSSHYHGTHDQSNDQEYTNERYAQYNGYQGLSQNTGRAANQEFNHKINYNQENSNERNLYNQNQQNQQYNQAQNNEYSESNWNIPSSRNLYNNKQTNQANNQEASYKRFQTGKSFNQQNSEEYDQQQMNKNNQRNQNYGSSVDFFSTSSAGFSSESSSQEDYMKAQNENNDIAKDIGRRVAQKMVKIYSIIKKYAARNGTVQTKQAQEPLTLRQWAIPMANHNFMNMNDAKVYGLNQGIIEAMYVNTERNCVDLKYFFDNMQVQGNMKASMGPKGSFQLRMANTNVNVSTELENHNRNFANSRNGKIDISYHNFQESTTDSQSMNEYIESKYVQFINRAIESEMIDNSYNGLVRCLRSEIESSFEMPSYTNSDLIIVNKKSQLTVSLLKNQIYNDDQTDNQRKIQYVAFRKNKSGNGYQLKVKVVLAKYPQWESEVVAQKANQHININNVKFQAEQIVAYAVMEHVQQNGEDRFNVKDASIKLDGFKCDIGKFNLAQNSNEKLAREVGQNIQNIVENGMSAALQQELYHQQQICQQNTLDCVRCNNQYNN